ncbi:hypothetical protein DL546_002909 [Coniochaeta pulveracea]|uniref:Uncharacterized protein n=1 Tax=Coniochaeta pulveracea TaxID=177199 RepID=A0A420Y9D9_9PEZI|nr:hypothetical protein DL546_002909 [Coniochaeta pulveracea]
MHRMSYIKGDVAVDINSYRETCSRSHKCLASLVPNINSRALRQRIKSFYKTTLGTMPAPMDTKAAQRILEKGKDTAFAQRAAAAAKRNTAGTAASQNSAGSTGGGGNGGSAGSGAGGNTGTGGINASSGQ